MDKATPTTPPAPASYDSVMALYKEVMEALLFDSDSVADAETEFLAEVERLAAQVAPSSAHSASLCGDVEPFVFEEYPYNSEAMGCGLEDRDITDRYEAMAYGWSAAMERAAEAIPDDLYPASTVAALKAERDALRARVAELEKDTARLEFVCNSPNRMVERENGLWRVYEDVAPTDRPTAVWQGITPRWHVTPREAIDAAITAALTKGQP